RKEHVLENLFGLLVVALPDARSSPRHRLSRGQRSDQRVRLRGSPRLRVQPRFLPPPALAGGFLGAYRIQCLWASESGTGLIPCRDDRVPFVAPSLRRCFPIRLFLAPALVS